MWIHKNGIHTDPIWMDFQNHLADVDFGSKKKHCSVWSLQKTCWLPWEKQIPSRNLTIHCKNHRIAQDNRWTPSIILGLYMFHFGKKILLYDYMIRISDLYWFIAKKKSNQKITVPTVHVSSQSLALAISYSIPVKYPRNDVHPRYRFLAWI